MFFVLIFNVEGFLNVIVEVMCLGKFVIVINCKFGLVEIIVECFFYEIIILSIEKNGILCFMNN